MVVPQGGALAASRPLLIVSFVNRVASIGLGLLPALLVERAVSPGEASLVMGVVKAAALVGVLYGGWLTDRRGARTALLAGFTVAGIGMAGLASPVALPLGLLALAAACSQAGSSMYPGAARLLLVESVPTPVQKEAVAWLRMINNLGSLVAYSLGALAGGLGVGPLMGLDAAMSFAAVAVGGRVLPRQPPAAPTAQGTPPGGFADAWLPFVLATLVVAGYGTLYDGFLTAAAARYRLALGPAGVQLFSGAMMVNTILCTLLAVGAARALENPARVLPAGMVLTAAGAVLGVIDPASIPLALLAMFVLTLGEVLFGALGAYVHLRLVPRHRRQGLVYSGAMLVQIAGRTLGASLAFPLFVHGEHPVRNMIIFAVPIVLLTLVARPAWRAFAVAVHGASG